ncbi:MAG: hypothetical protein JNJ48_01900 [Phycisphaerae bacterium]|nr:hypothetical protein [Phycisphaerae bacterium]
MRNAPSILSEADRRTVAGAIEAAERRMGAELVVVVASRSARYLRADDLTGLAAGMVLATAANVASMRPAASGDWSWVVPAPVGLIGTLALVVAGWLAGVWACARWPRLSAWARGRAEMQEQVRRRGSDCFVNLRVRNTRGGTGVLIYVSLLERLVWVVADDAVAAKVGPETWHGMKDRIVQRAAQGALSAGLVEAIGLAADVLAPHFPPEPDRADELPNTVHLLG